MSRSLRRGAIAVIALAAILPLSACAAGNSPDTLQIKPDNAATSIGNDLKLNNIVVVTAVGSSSEHAGPANLTVNISNSGSSPETLQSVTIGEGVTATFADAKGAALSEIVIPAGGAVLLGGEGQPVARVGSAKLEVGGFAPTSFSFAKAGKVSTEAQVHPADGLYAGYGPKAAASASPSASASASTGASASPSASASASASAGASGSASPSAGASASPSTSVAASH
ncbi:DUF461 domain-containing protein [Kitasatospora sp. NPDC002040]|uniref:DUF461 domain-containing protein n=1 Tax=Kitasatospora sp. NPDC002040 TaxID=3154661 RepID=UPI003325C17C